MGYRGCILRNRTDKSLSLTGLAYGVLPDARRAPIRLGILPGTFNPVTIAHLALAHSGLSVVDEVVFVLPRAFPHKLYSGASFRQRMEMLQDALRHDAAFSIAAAGSGLFVDIAAECRAAYSRTTRLTFLCGRDAAERIAHWDYGVPGAFDGMLRQFDLLVAGRRGDYQVPAEWNGAIERLELPGLFDHVSVHRGTRADRPRRTVGAPGAPRSAEARRARFTGRIAPMPRYFAFLRAINVGGRVVRMEALRGLFSGLGFSEVETLINSGNLIFRCGSTKPAVLETRIAGHLESSLGYPVATFLRTDAELAAIHAYRPFEEEAVRTAATCCAGFLARPLEGPQREALFALQTDVDRFQVNGREVYWLSREKQSQSKITNAVLERKLKVPLTFRNLTTVAKLAGKYL